jgi:hypothetical protein
LLEKSKTEGGAKYTFDGKVSDIIINMTSEKYNHLINMKHMVEMNGKHLASKIMINEKEDILKFATKTGPMWK